VAKKMVVVPVTKMCRQWRQKSRTNMLRWMRVDAVRVEDVETLLEVWFLLP
jgi:hypothetical protein